MQRMSSFSSPMLLEVLEHVPVGMILLSPEGDILAANGRFLDMVDWSEEELDGVRFPQIIYSSDEPVVSSFIDRLARGEAHQAGLLVRAARKDGSIAWWRLWGFSRGAEVLLGVFDITDQKVTEEHLRKEREEAIRSVQSKSRFLANMSHEIRTPLHTILGMTELLEDTRLDEEQRDYVQQIRFSGEALLALINDILDYSKIEAGKLPMEIIDFDLYEVVEQAVGMVSLQAHKKHLEVVVDIGEEVPRRVKGDPLRIRQILVNLANNAVKFTEKGHVFCRVQLVQQRKGVAWVAFTVEDTGIGIPENKKHRLFRVFSQIDESTTRRFGGTGLGLAISKSLVEMMKGEIGVRSREGEGSSFWFLLPLPIVESYEPPVSLGEVGSLLLVEDYPLTRRVLHRYLQRYFPHIDDASTGAEALRKMRERAERGEIYDLVLVDLTLPGMDGWQFASEVNADRSINDTRMVLMSPMGEGAEAKMKLLKWFDAYLAKPVRKDDLYRTVARVVNEEMELEGVEAEGPEGGEERPADAGNYLILVAEDHIVNQELFFTILSRLGYRVELAGNGKEAVEKGLALKPDLIFMDVQMPEMNGYDAARVLREHGYEGPVIAVTASAFREDRERALAAGMSDFLPKPFKKKDLLPVLQKWLSDTKRDGPAPESASTETVPVEKVGEEDLFDLTGAREAFMDDMDVLSNVIDRFFERLPQQFGRIEEALSRQDAETVRTEAHGIKGGSWNLSMKLLGDLAAEMETAAKEGDISRCKQLFPRLKQGFVRTKEYVERSLSPQHS
ncbi:multi-sensor hybrid histidine kinase [Spirochaeta thermophila DSM 6578]|uniref:Sensory/regulatory protein RpfC n=2 Tax=Winmispira thermophila TaxID=154 RepID=G0GB66_WINT7|nr:multi-sensor hybrid histidine kinase [Spirochaeta thermophila DSM 6578]